MAANPPRVCAWHFNPQLWRDHRHMLREATQSPLYRALLASHISLWMPSEDQVLYLDDAGVSCWCEHEGNRRLLLRDLHWDSFYVCLTAGEGLMWPDTAPAPEFGWNASVMTNWLRSLGLPNPDLRENRLGA